VQRVNAGGHYFISSTRLRGTLALRICTCGWRTTDDDIAGLIGEVREAVRSEK